MGGDEIEYELALGEPGDYLERAGEQALALLEDRFPGVRDAAREIEEPPGLSRRASNGLHGIAQTAARSRPPNRRRTPSHHASLRSLSRLYEIGLAHPVLARATVTLSMIVIVHYLAYIALAVLALAALKTSRSRTDFAKLPNTCRKCGKSLPDSHDRYSDSIAANVSVNRHRWLASEPPKF